MILFTLDEIETFVMILTEQLRAQGARISPQDLLNPESEMYAGVIQRFIVQIEDKGITLHDMKNPLNRGSRSAKDRATQAMNPQNMGVEETAEYLRVSVNTLYKWTSQGKVPHSKVGSKKLSFSRTDLDEFLRTRRVAGDLEINQRANNLAERLRNGRR